MISPFGDHSQQCSGHILGRSGAHLTALVDAPLTTESGVTVVLPDDSFVGEVVRCTHREVFVVHVVLISRDHD